MEESGEQESGRAYHSATMFVAPVAAITFVTRTGRTPTGTLENVTVFSLPYICTTTSPVPPIYNPRVGVRIVESDGVTATAKPAGSEV
jgi:hypothetical protein